VLITAVLFDFDHTLGVDNRLEEHVLSEMAGVYCSVPPSEASIQTVLYRFRHVPGVPLDSALADGLRSWGCPEENIADGVKAFRQRCLAEAPQFVQAIAGAQQMLAALRARRTPLGILSNGWTQLQHLKAQIIGFPGPVLASEEIGAWKPDRAAFDIALERFSMVAATTLYVGDNPEMDVAGAKGAGLLAGWADLEGKTYPADAPLPDFTVTALLEILNLGTK